MIGTVEDEGKFILDLLVALGRGGEHFCTLPGDVRASVLADVAALRDALAAAQARADEAFRERVAAQARRAVACALLRDYMRASLDLSRFALEHGAPKVLPDDHPLAWIRALPPKVEAHLAELQDDTAALDAALRKARADALREAGAIIEREAADLATGATAGEQRDAERAASVIRMFAARLRRMAGSAETETAE